MRAGPGEGTQPLSCGSGPGRPQGGAGVRRPESHLEPGLQGPVRRLAPGLTPTPAEPELRPPQRVLQEEASAIREFLVSLKLDLKQPLEKVSAWRGCRPQGLRRLRWPYRKLRVHGKCQKDTTRGAVATGRLCSCHGRRTRSSDGGPSPGATVASGTQGLLVTSSARSPGRRAPGVRPWPVAGTAVPGPHASPSGAGPGRCDVSSAAREIGSIRACDAAWKLQVFRKRK